MEEALHKAVPARLEVDVGRCGLAANRDFAEPESGRRLVGWNPLGVADDTLLCGRVSDEKGECLATIVNYACHPTILAWENNTISPDFPGAMREIVEEATGGPCLFLQGASGELAPRHQYVGDPEVADRAGRSLGHAVLAVLHGMLPPGDELNFAGAVPSGALLAEWRQQRRRPCPSKIRTRTVGVDLRLKPDLPSVDELESQLTACADRVVGEQLTRKLAIRKALGDGDISRAESEVWQLGDVMWVSVANEAYSLLQVELRKTAGPAPLFIATVTNGGHGYLPPAAFYHFENYAAWQSPFAEGCLEQTIAALRRQIEAFRDGTP